MGGGGGEKKEREDSGASLSGGREGDACSTIMAKVVGGYSCEGAY